MKNQLLFLVMFCSLFVFFNSCSSSNDERELEEEKCWEFTLHTVAKATGSGYTSTDRSTTTQIQCGLTASEAKQTAKSMEGTSTTHGSGYSVCVTITVTYKLAEDDIYAH